MKRLTGLVVLLCCVAVWFNIGKISSVVGAQMYPKPQYTVNDQPLQGQPDYPVALDKHIDYWIVNCPVSDDTTREVDRVLENLNADHIAQTVFLCIQQPVPEATSYAERFLRYMALGLPDGERKNNGLVFLIIHQGDSLDIHYGVGFGLAALTAQGLSPINRLGEDNYKSTKSLDQAVIDMANALSNYARSKYQPWNPTSPSYGSSSTKEEIPSSVIWLCIGLFCAILLITETLFSAGALLGSNTLFNWIFWPVYLLMAIADSSGSGSSGNSYSSSSYSSGGSSGGHSGSGGGGTGRGN